MISSETFHLSSNNREDPEATSVALDAMGIEMESESFSMKEKMAIGMFDTKGVVNPFSAESPLKQCAITTFPPDFFFVLRVVQLIRGMKQGMEVRTETSFLSQLWIQIDVNFSSAKLWKNFARKALNRQKAS